jgi:hypothetical protein
VIDLYSGNKNTEISIIRVILSNYEIMWHLHEMVFLYQIPMSDLISFASLVIHTKFFLYLHYWSLQTVSVYVKESVCVCVCVCVCICVWVCVCVSMAERKRGEQGENIYFVYSFRQYLFDEV